MRERERERQREREDTMPSNDLVLEAVYHSFCLILFVRMESLSPAHSQWEGIRLHLLKGRVSKNLWTYFKITALI